MNGDLKERWQLVEDAMHGTPGVFMLGVGTGAVGATVLIAVALLLALSWV